MFKFLIASFLYMLILHICNIELDISKLLNNCLKNASLLFTACAATMSYATSLLYISRVAHISVSMIIFVVVFLSIFLIRKAIFSYVPKKSKEIYDYVFAHRGFHLEVPENSLPAFKTMIGKFGIEVDVRYLEDGNIVCFHDRYTSRLLGIPGKTTDYTYKELRKFKLKGTKYRVMRLQDLLYLVSGKSPLLIEVKGLMSKKYFLCLKDMISNYDGEVFFHCKNIITYFRLNREYNKKVFWVLNIFRKRFNFLKGKHYKNNIEKIKAVFEEASIEIPTIEDISQMLVESFEDNESVSEICASISGVINNYKTRVDAKHWLTNSVILHRGIVSNRFKEHSREAFEGCVKFAEYTNTNVTIELDLMYHDGKVLCYHSDRASDKLGQEKSCAEKMNIKDALTLEEIIGILNGHEKLVSVIFDLKDFHAFNRVLEREIVRILDETGYRGNFAVQAWNPLALMYFEKVRPEYIRGQVGHSLSGLVKYVPLNGLPWVVNVFLFNRSHADYCVYDASNFIYVLLKYNKDIKGRPVFIYAPKSEHEIRSFIGKEQITGFIVENVLDNKSWSKAYIRKFKHKNNTLN